jgi:hypothetical protein
MVTVTVPKIKYEELKRQADAYRRFFRSAAAQKWHELKKDFEDHMRCEIAIRQSKGKKHYSLKEMKKRYGLK